jgi:hypothetical protein
VPKKTVPSRTVGLPVTPTWPSTRQASTRLDARSGVIALAATVVVVPPAAAPPLPSSSPPLQPVSEAAPSATASVAASDTATAPLLA